MTEQIIELLRQAEVMVIGDEHRNIVSIKATAVSAPWRLMAGLDLRQ